MTERLYYIDPYRVQFEAHTVEHGPDLTRVVLDRSAFYPTSGGQPHDTGTLGGIPVVSVEDREDGAVVHVLASPLDASGGPLTGDVDWARRFDHMQQHTGQHLLSAVFVDLFGFETRSFHMGAELSTIELGCPSLSASQMAAAEVRANELIAENRGVRIDFEDAGSVEGLRKTSERTGTLRIVTIEGLDRSACGGTHVRSTGEIGCILLRKTERIRGNTRLEFVCGLRAARRATTDFRLLSAISETMSAAIDDTAGVASNWSGRLAEAEKERRRVALELAQFTGRDLYSRTEATPAGRRVSVRVAESIGEEMRAEAQSFTAGSQAVYIAAATAKPAVLVAVSADAGQNAGSILKELLSKHGGRGGGTALLAQGSVADRASLDAVLSALRGYF
ncbi:MAG: DHHA1 domain-containing protein [Bryobacteraceae bacterium]|nr:DHHA1 domain-containing protein [Bryobacteraceae bacterium]